MSKRCRAVLKAVSVIVLAGSVVVSAGCQTAKSVTSTPTAVVSAPLTPAQRQANVESFDLVWQLVRDRHYDPKLNGVDWNAVRDELRPKMEAATTEEQARAILTDMISRLGQSHMAVLPAEAYTAEENETADAKAPAAAGDVAAKGTAAVATGGAAGGAAASAGGAADEESEQPGTVGIDVRVEKGRAFVTSVADGSPAAIAGVRMGWEVVSVGRANVRKGLSRMAQEEGVGMPISAIQSMQIRSLVNGEVGRTVHVGFLDGQDKAVTKSLVAVKPDGVAVKFGQLPEVNLELRKKLLPGDIAYISTNIWLDPIRTMKFVESAINEYPTAKGFIIDLRGNPGGLGVMAMGMGGFFVTERNQVLGEMKMRQGNQRFILNPRKPSFTGPVAILIDDLSASTSEIFAGGMRDIGRARVFGTRSAGAALPSVIEILPNGDRFQYVFANYTSANGSVLEGNGVVPDVVVPFDRAALLRGEDPVVEKARAWILSQSPAVSLNH